MRNLGGNLGVKHNRDSYAVAVAIALLLASVLLVVFYVVDSPPPDEYTTIYLLDSNGKTNYPDFVYIGVNSTFNVYVYVVNHEGRPLEDAQVKVKIANESNFTELSDVDATQIFTSRIEDGATWKNMATVSLNQLGNYLVAFELWIPNRDNGILEDSGNFVALNVQVA